MGAVGDAGARLRDGEQIIGVDARPDGLRGAEHGEILPGRVVERLERVRMLVDRDAGNPSVLRLVGRLDVQIGQRAGEHVDCVALGEARAVELAERPIQQIDVIDHNGHGRAPSFNYGRKINS